MGVGLAPFKHVNEMATSSRFFGCGKALFDIAFGAL